MSDQSTNSDIEAALDVEADAQDKASEEKVSGEKVPEEKMRRIKSFVKRTGRMTSGQQLSYEKLMPKFGLQHQASSIDLQQVFGNTNPVNLEIGFGMGDSLALMALAAKQENFIGIEVHTPGVGRLLQLMDQDGIENIRVYEHDAIDILKDCIADESINRIQIYFPDPWHKKKHHKRRLVQPAFIDLLWKKLKPEGLLHIATDWQPYSEHVLNLFAERKDFANLSVEENGCVEKPKWRPETKFERRGVKLGHGVYDMLFRKSNL